MKFKLLSVLILLLLVNTATSYALFESDVDKAKDYIKAGMFNQAIPILNQTIIDNPTNKDAHFLLAKCYLDIGNDYSAEERFNSANKLSSKYVQKTANAYRQAADKAFTNNKLERAKNLFIKAMRYNSSLKAEACKFFIKLGNNASSNQAEAFYGLALNNCNEDPMLKKQIGEKYLKLAVFNTSKRESLLKKAKVLGIKTERIKQIFPDPYVKVLFDTKAPLTFNNAYNKSGQIEAFDSSKFDVRRGDVIEVITKLKGGKEFSGDEIWIWRGKNFTPKWATTNNGYYRKTMNVNSNKGIFIISLGGRQDVEVVVKVTRIINPEPNIALLDKL